MTCCCPQLAGKGCSVTSRWPRLTAHLQRSAGGRLLTLQMWSIQRGQPVRQYHWLLGGRPCN